MRRIPSILLSILAVAAATAILCTGVKVLSDVTAARFRKQILGFLESRGGAAPGYSAIEIRPGYPFKFSIRSLEMAPDPTVALAVDVLDGEFFPEGLLRRACPVKNLRFIRPRLTVNRLTDQVWDVFFRAQTDATGPLSPGRNQLGRPHRIALAYLVIEDGRLDILDSDFAPGLRLRVRDVAGVLNLDPSHGTVASFDMTARGIIPAGGKCRCEAAYARDRQALRVRLTDSTRRFTYAGDISFDGNRFDGKGRIGLRRIRPQELFAWIKRTGPRPLSDGRISVEADVYGTGTRLDEILANSGARGALEIRDGTLQGIGLLERILGPIADLPGMEDLREHFRESPGLDTGFEIFRADFQIVNATALVRSADLKTRDYLLDASGEIGILTGEAQIRGRLILFEKPTGLAVSRVPRLAQLVNERGRLIVPFLWQGRGADLQIVPDLAALSAQLKPVSLTRKDAA